LKENEFAYRRMLKKNDIRCISHFKNHAVPIMKRQELTITREAIKILMLSPIYFLLTGCRNVLFWCENTVRR
jgi:hypothetical protein